jgi:hypothetical protein
MNRFHDRMRLFVALRAIEILCGGMRSTQEETGRENRHPQLLYAA